MNEWQTIIKQTNQTSGIITTTEVLELPHGCLVQSTVRTEPWFGQPGLATALAFVPNMKLERHEDMVAFAHKP